MDKQGERPRRAKDKYQEQQQQQAINSGDETESETRRDDAILRA